MLTREKRLACEHFAEGRKCYKRMQFRDALEHFREALACDPHDGPSKVYVERCEHYLASPPSEDWDGVFEMQSK
ncbi:MAG: hypothetical protein ACLFM0_07715 [Spirochaetales bacterium]